MNYSKLSVGLVFVFLCSVLLSSCIWAGPRRSSRRCYKNSRGQTVCQAVRHSPGHRRGHGRRR
jgi:hypothetical protein